MPKGAATTLGDGADLVVVVVGGEPVVSVVVTGDSVSTTTLTE